jgi:hypothetical protein
MNVDAVRRSRPSGFAESEETPVRRPALAVAAALVAALVASPAQAAPGDMIVSQTDARGDVRLLSDDGGLTDAQRRSIDMRKVTVTEQAGGVRFSVKLKQLTTARKFDQIVEVRLLPDNDDDFWSTTVGFSPQNRTSGYAFYAPTLDGDDVVSCDPLITVVRRAKRTVHIDVPTKCLPKERARIEVGSFTGEFRGEGVGYSRDRLNVLGTHQLR